MSSTKGESSFTTPVGRRLICLSWLDEPAPDPFDFRDVPESVHKEALLAV